MLSLAFVTTQHKINEYN